MLNEVLNSLSQYGFKASVFANSDGLILASAKTAETNEKIIGAMVAMLTDSAEKARDEMGLSDLLSMVIKYKDATIYCRQIVLENSPTTFLLASLAPPASSEDVEKYHSQLIDWAVTNGIPPLQKLVDI
jgi:predicted regulator of Ras-like GTPase activity (Roadblock/LC7/MglB family)